ISGRWVDQQVLERLSRRSQGPEAVARRELIAEFCRAVGWRDSHGRLCVSSAHVALRRLEKRGVVQLPPMAQHNKGSVGRGLREVGRHWRSRYGLRPVLVETYVDRVRYHCRSLAAANWQRLGQTKGRGRDDRQRKCAQSPKDVWLYELHPKARAQLQACTAEVVAPRSVFAPALNEDWTQEEMQGVGDERLNQRAQRM